MSFVKHIDKDSLTLSTQASEVYEGRWKKFNIVLTPPTTMDEVDEKLYDYIMYKMDLDEESALQTRSRHDGS
jgi:hypothetical protein